MTYRFRLRGKNLRHSWEKDCPPESAMAHANLVARECAKDALYEGTAIRVNAIGPGSIMTDILKRVATDQAAKNRLLSRTPLGRIADPDEIASVAAFLASKDASYLTGETIYVDGGRLALNYTVPVPGG